MYHMIHNYTGYRILRLFFDYPTKGFQLREICRMAKLGMPSVKLHIKRLENEGFVKMEKTGVYASYRASKNERFRRYKLGDMLLRLYDSGFVDFLENEFSPNAVVLFGSASRGEDTERSDIDILILAKEKEIELKEYESSLKRKISIMFESDVRKLPKELRNNVINGIVVYGYLKVF